MGTTLPDGQAVEWLVEDVNRKDRTSAWALIILGIPFALLGVCGLTLPFYVSGMLFGLESGTAFFVALGTALAAVVIGTWLHPSEHLVPPRYYLASGEEVRPSGLGRRGGMPAMTSMSDPRNLVMFGRVIASGFTTLVLGGPRMMRKGIELLVLARRRSRPAVISSAAEFAKWLSGKGSLLEDELRAELERRPALVPGFMLAEDLDLLVHMKTDGGKVVKLRGV